MHARRRRRERAKGKHASEYSERASAMREMVTEIMKGEARRESNLTSGGCTREWQKGGRQARVGTRG